MVDTVGSLGGYGGQEMEWRTLQTIALPRPERKLLALQPRHS